MPCLLKKIRRYNLAAGSLIRTMTGLLILKKTPNFFKGLYTFLSEKIEGTLDFFSGV